MRRFWTTAVFLGIISAILYVANLVVYEALAVMFGITVSWQLLLLGALLGILSGSFILATLAGMRYYNVFTRLYYLLSAVWIGSFVYLFLASLLYGLLVIVAPLQSVGEVLVAVAVLVSIYAVIHAKRMYVTEVPITLANLPSQWRGRRAVWISDLHLGQLHGSSFAHRVVEKVNALQHDIIFIGGDLFDGTGAPDIPELTEPLKAFSAPLGTYFITGNHEEFGDSTKFIAAVKGAGIRVLDDNMVEIDGLQLVGVDYHNASDELRFRDILSKLSLNPDMPSVLLKHEPKDLAVAESAGISLQISGHTHKAQLWPLSYIAQLTYKGFAYGLKSFKGMQVYTSSGTGTWGPPMRVGSKCEVVVFTFL